MPNRFSVAAAKAVVAEKSQNLADAAKASSRLWLRRSNCREACFAADA
jgi:hypothetical protein